MTSNVHLGDGCHIHYLDKKELNKHATLRLCSNDRQVFHVNRLLLVSNSRMFYEIFKSFDNVFDDIELILTDLSGDRLEAIVTFVTSGILPGGDDYDTVGAFRAFGIELPTVQRVDKDNDTDEHLLIPKQEPNDPFEDSHSQSDLAARQVSKEPVVVDEDQPLQHKKSKVEKPGATNQQSVDEYLEDFFKTKNYTDDIRLVENALQTRFMSENIYQRYFVYMRLEEYVLPHPLKSYLVDASPAPKRSRSKGPVECKKCLDSGLERHDTEAHHRTLLQCSHCAKAFLRCNEATFRSHVRKHEWPSGGTQCILCGYENKTLAGQLKHIRLMGKYHDNKCPQCPERSRSHAAYCKHIDNDHNNVWVYKCGRCGELCKTQELLGKHRRSKHYKPLRKAPESKVDKKRVCHLCGSVLCDKSYLKHHMRRVHAEKVFSCPHCQYCAGDAGALRRHIQRSHDKAPCPHCGQMVPKGKMGLHIKVHHLDSASKKFLCSTCNRGFMDRAQYRDHMNRHTGKRPYKCKYCDKDFVWNANYYAHIKQCHEGLKRTENRKNTQ